MKILVVCQYYFPEQFRINDICEELVKIGHEVTVLTGLPNYPQGVIPQEYKFGKRRKEKINGVNVVRTFEIARGKGTFRLGLNYLSYMFSASLKILSLKKDYELIFVYQLSPVTMAFPAIVAKEITKKPIYLYSCDIWPESMKNLISNENNRVYKIVKRLSTYIYSRCDVIGVTSKPFVQYFEGEHLISSDKIVYLPQHAEESNLTINNQKDDEIIDFFFMGNIGIAQDIECILKAVKELDKNLKFKVHFVGDGSYLSESKAYVMEHNLLDYVVFHGRHPVEKMPDFYEIADVCLLTLKNDNLIGQTMPSKLQGYMAAGKPILGAINGAAKDVIEESNCGVCVDSGDYRTLAHAMKEFIINYEKYRVCGENGRQFFMKNFTKEIFIQQLTKKFDEIIEENKNV